MALPNVEKESKFLTYNGQTVTFMKAAAINVFPVSFLKLGTSEI